MIKDSKENDISKVEDVVLGLPYDPVPTSAKKNEFTEKEAKNAKRLLYALLILTFAGFIYMAFNA